jgi:CubicO group peptidase (beta-lactamase class C family)
LNREQFHEFIAKSTRNESNICQITALKDGKTVYEDCWHGYGSDDAVHVASVTKSVVSLLTGIAIDKGLIKSIDDKILDYFPEYQVKRGEKTIYDVTIRHLLTMRAPYKCKGDPWSKVCASEDWVKTSLDFVGGRKGLTDEFKYSTVCIHVLSGILYKASGMITVDFANKYLFDPLGIRHHENYYAKSAEEHRAFTLEKTPKDHVWFADRDGLGTPGYGLCMSAKDMAKIGQMCLDNGKYNGRQIVSQSWIKDMTSPRAVEGKMFRGMQYGYLWWIIHPESNVYAAIGNSGNVIYINPKENTVVALTAYFKPTVMDRVDFIEDKILPILV